VAETSAEGGRTDVDWAVLLCGLFVGTDMTGGFRLWACFLRPFSLIGEEDYYRLPSVRLTTKEEDNNPPPPLSPVGCFCP